MELLVHSEVQIAILVQCGGDGTDRGLHRPTAGDHPHLPAVHRGACDHAFPPDRRCPCQLLPGRLLRPGRVSSLR